MKKEHRKRKTNTRPDANYLQ